MDIVPNGPIVAILPVKPSDIGKSRLAPVLSPIRRKALSLLLLDRVLAACQGTNPPLTPWILGDHTLVETLGRQNSVHHLTELGKGLNDTLQRAMELAVIHGAAATLYLPPDLPFVKPEDLNALLTTSESLHYVVLAPARRDGGTNAILVPSGKPFPLQLGKNSFQKHLEQARQGAWEYRTCDTLGTGFDLDVPQDLEHCQKADQGFASELDRWERILVGK